MKNIIAGLLIASLALVLTIVPASCQQKPKEEVKPSPEGKETVQKAMGESLEAGQVLFKKHCAVCHPDGGNIINPKKTLNKKDLEANNMKTAEDIVNNMRNPGPGMTKFTEEKISKEEATAIAEYILHAFQ
jgi:mono/diheme cytochrome c family protein